MENMITAFRQRKGELPWGREWEEAWKILMEAGSVLYMFPPGERPFGSSYSRSNKLEASHNQHTMRIFLGNLFLINESPH